MAKAARTTKVKDIKVRMYRGGTGDCFLLQFMKGSKPGFNMLIDCGSILGGKPQFDAIAADIKKVAGNVIDLLVITHQHADHINGFEKASDLFSKFTFKKVWFAWTEDDEDPVANDYRANHSELGIAVDAAATKLNGLVRERYYEKIFKNEAGGNFMLEGKKGFINTLSALNGLNPVKAKKGKPLPTMVEMFKGYNIIKGNTVVELLEPGDVRSGLPGAEGMRFYVLGPPRDSVYLNRTEKEGENFEQREKKSKIDFAFLSAMDATSSESEVNKLPFDPEYELAGSTHAILQDYEKGGDWRKIDYDWLYSAGSLALRYQRSINNTSLALAIQFEDSERVLLFPADAEFGNWESWHDGLTWPVKVKGQIVKKDATYFLNNTVFYKVGHHLSQNGTPTKKGINLMTSPDLTAMATLDFKKINTGWLNTMPNDLLGAELIKKCKGKVYFAGDCGKILKNIKTNRVTVKLSDEKVLLSLNKKFDGENFIECLVEG